jgi:outer membrane lipoprotein-sorting protein
MKRFFYAYFLLFSFGISSVLAQKDPNALRVLDKMSERYRAIPAYEAAFTYSIYNEQEGIQENMRGTLLVKGEQFRLLMDGQQIYCDGAVVWTYIEENNEVNIDHYYPEEMEMSPTRIYTAYKKGFNFKMLEEQKRGAITEQVVELTPQDASSAFSRIRLNIDKTEQSLNSWTIFDKNGNRYTYTVTAFNAKATPAKDDFVFNPAKFPGVEIVDLR